MSRRTRIRSAVYEVLKAGIPNAKVFNAPKSKLDPTKHFPAITVFLQDEDASRGSTLSAGRTRIENVALLELFFSAIGNDPDPEPLVESMVEWADYILFANRTLGGLCSDIVPLELTPYHEQISQGPIFTIERQYILKYTVEQGMKPV